MNEQRIIKQFAEQIHMEFDVSNVTIYKNNDRLFGDEINRTSLERCLSITCTTVFREDNSSYLVSHLAVRNNLFVIILFSDCKTTFDGLDSKYIIGELKKLKKELGETE